MRPILLAAIALALAGCQASAWSSARAAEPYPREVRPAVFRPALYAPPVRRAIFHAPLNEPTDGAIELVSDRQPARFPLARGVIDCFRLRVPNPCPRVCPPAASPIPAPPAEKPEAEKPEERKPKPDGTLPLSAAAFALCVVVSIVGRAGAALMR